MAGVSNFFKKAVSSKLSLFIVFVLLTFVATYQAFNVTNPEPAQEGKVVYKDYNNYIIFTNSFKHLVNDQDLYVAYPQEQDDLYKYTPTFSVFFGVFALFPDWFGLGLWNLLNVLILFFSVYYLPRLTHLQKGLILLLGVIEMVTSIQNEQSNALIVGMLIFALGLLENRKYAWATFLIMFAAYIKLFGLVGFLLFLFYPQKWKLAAYSAFWAVLLFIVPLLFVDFEQYSFLWDSFSGMLANDHSASYGYSVMGCINTWFSVDINKNMVVLIGLFFLLLPFIRVQNYRHLRFKLLALSSVLIWVVIFNHKAESPTFIIAMAGVAIWFITSKKSRLDVGLVIFAFIFTSLSATDLFPPFVRENFIKPYAIKAVPSILIWVKIVYEMVTFKPTDELEILRVNDKKQT